MLTCSRSRKAQTTAASSTSAPGQRGRNERTRSSTSGVHTRPSTKKGSIPSSRPMLSVESRSGSSGAITEIATAKTSGWRSWRSTGVSRRHTISANRNHSVQAGTTSCSANSCPSSSALPASCTIWKITYGTSIAVSRRFTCRGSLR